MSTLQIAAEEISKALEADLVQHHIRSGAEPIPENQLRDMAIEVVFKIISEQLPDQPRNVRRELARQYEAECWRRHKEGAKPDEAHSSATQIVRQRHDEVVASQKAAGGA